jgi:hypothetical protein
VKSDWRKMQNEELHNLYSTQNIKIMIKLRGVKWEGHVARMAGMRPEDKFEYPGEDRRISKKTGKLQSLEYTKIPKVFFMPH